jgi:SAM-dependent methyltransferase
VGGLLRADAATRVLDVACGDGRVAAVLPAGAAYVGVDLSPVAVGLARARWAARPECRFAAMDAGALAFPDAAFDLVTFVDAAEHVLDIEAALAECARVLRPGGRLIATGANRDSLNQVMARKLGFGEFMTNYQHVREFAFDEFTGLLAAQGLVVRESAGILLFPYWGVPRIDAVVRHLTDDDPEVVELMRALGDKAGPRHAYTFVVAAEKTG